MKIVFQNDETRFFEFDSKNKISLPAGLYKLHYCKLSEVEWEDGERFDNLPPAFVGEIEMEGEFTILKTGAKVEFWISGYNDYDRCDPYILKFQVTVLDPKEIV